MDVAKKAIEIAQVSVDTVYNLGDVEIISPDTGEPIQCSYLVGEAGNGKGCIFGQAMMALNPEIESTLKQKEGRSVFHILRKLAKKDVSGHEHALCSAMTSVQIKQDDRQTWGNAVKDLIPLVEKITKEIS